MSFRGATAFITGGSSGLGLGLVQACLEREMKVVATYRTPEHKEQALDQLGHPENLHFYELDVTGRESMEQICQLVGDVDLLVANAGIGCPRSILAASPQERD